MSIAARQRVRRNAYTARLWLIAGGLGFALLCVLGAAAVVLAARTNRSGESARPVAAESPPADVLSPAPPVSTRSALAGVSAEREGLSWTHQELVDHLNRESHGQSPNIPRSSFRLIATTTGSIAGPAAYFAPDRGTGFDYSEGAVRAGATTAVYVQRCETADAAAGRAGAKGRDQAFSWGRFYFGLRGDDTESTVAYLWCRKVMLGS